MHETDSTWKLVVFSGVAKIINLGSLKLLCFVSLTIMSFTIWKWAGNTTVFLTSKLFLQSEINSHKQSSRCKMLCVSMLSFASELLLEWVLNRSNGCIIITTNWDTTQTRCLLLKNLIIIKLPLSLIEAKNGPGFAVLFWVSKGSLFN